MVKTPTSAADTMTAPESGFEEWGDRATLPVNEVHDFFVTMTKALRAFQLYEENNPVYLRFLSSLREAFGSLWQEIDALHILVDKDSLRWSGQEVYREESRKDSLAFLLYRGGIRDFTLLQGLETDELERFLQVLQRARMTSSEDEELLSILWEEDLQFVRYSYIELGGEGIDIPDPGDGGGVDPKAVVEEMMADEGGQPVAETDEERPTLTLTQDFRPTLYFLDPHEMARLRDELTKEMRRPVRADVLAALFDRLEEPEHRERQSEILDILSTLLPNLLSQGALATAAEILAEVSDLLDAEDKFDGPRRHEAEIILEEASSSEAIAELARALEDGSITPDAVDLGNFVRRLRSGALAHLVLAATTAPRRDLREVLFEAAEGIAERQPEAILELLLSQSDPAVLGGGLRLAGELGRAEAAGRIGELVKHEAHAVRVSAVEAATKLRSPTLVTGLQEALTDPEQEVRVAAARGLGELKFPGTGDYFREVLTRKELRQADLSEKILFFESYGRLGDTEAVPFLSKILNGRSFLGRKETADLRACAARSLGHVGSTEARKALDQAADDQDPVVRSAVRGVLRWEAEE